MGSGVSVVENDNLDGTYSGDVETFKALQSAYDSSKELDDVELFNMLANIYQTCTEGSSIESAATAGGKATSEIVEIKEESPEEQEAKRERNSSFIIACGAFHKGNAKADIEKAQKLFEDGVNVNYIDNDGWSALFHACGEGHLSVVEWLTENCAASVELKDPDGCTPLWVAAFNNRRNVVQHLLHIGADDTIKAEPEGEPTQTPSNAARRNKHPGVADFIDEETALRTADPARRGRQVAREMNMDEFRDSMRKKGGLQN